jgi:hypothetical protein
MADGSLTQKQLIAYWKIMNSIATGLLASPGTSHRAVLVLEILGIIVGAIVVILLIILLMKWLNSSDNENRVKIFTFAFIGAGIATLIAGYIVGNKIFYLVGLGLIGFPLLLGLLSWGSY